MLLLSDTGRVAKTAVDKVIHWNDQAYAGGAYWVHCPACGKGDNEMTHPVAVAILRGDDVIEVRRDEISIRPEVNEGRGVVIKLFFDCECDHRFSVEFSFCSGTTTVEAKNHGHVDSADSCKTIWRS